MSLLCLSQSQLLAYSLSVYIAFVRQALFWFTPLLSKLQRLWISKQLVTDIVQIWSDVSSTGYVQICYMDTIRIYVWISVLMSTVWTNSNYKLCNCVQLSLLLCSNAILKHQYRTIMLYSPLSHLVLETFDSYPLGLIYTRGLCSPLSCVLKLINVSHGKRKTEEI